MNTSSKNGKEVFKCGGWVLPIGTYIRADKVYTVTEDGVFRTTNFGTKKILGQSVKLSAGDSLVLEIELTGLARELGY